MMRLILVILALALVLGIGCDKIGTPATSTGQAVNGAGIADRKALSYEEQQGRHIYMKYCVVCHGTEGKGDGFNAYNLDPKPRDFTDSTYMRALGDSRLLETIGEGGRGVNKSPLMPSWGATLSKDDIVSVASYLKTFSQTMKTVK